MRFKGDKVSVSQTSMNRLYYGTHLPWQVLRNEGARLLVDDSRFGAGVAVSLPAVTQPSGPVVGIEVPDTGERFLTSHLRTRKGIKFTTTIAIPGEPFRVREARIPGLPTLIVDPRVEPVHGRAAVDVTDAQRRA